MYLLHCRENSRGTNHSKSGDPGGGISVRLRGISSISVPANHFILLMV